MAVERICIVFGRLLSLLVEWKNALGESDPWKVGGGYAQDRQGSGSPRDAFDRFS